MGHRWFQDFCLLVLSTVVSFVDGMELLILLKYVFSDHSPSASFLSSTEIYSSWLSGLQRHCLSYESTQCLGNPGIVPLHEKPHLWERGVYFNVPSDWFPSSCCVFSQRMQIGHCEMWWLFDRVRTCLSEMTTDGGWLLIMGTLSLALLLVTY